MKWTFRQIEGVSRKTLELDGYAAPFGRERKDPVIKELIKSRVQTTRYPGKKGPPTRHAFGIDWDDTDLKGRWMTKHLPANVAARDMADQWTDFVRDESLVEMSWGDYVTYVVFISELELGREDENNISWHMKLLVDERTNNVTKERVPKTEASLIDNSEEVLKILIRMSEAQKPVFLEDGLGFFDELSLAIGALNAFPATLNNLVNQVGDIERSTFGALNALRMGIKNVQTTVINARELATTTALDASTFARSAKNDLEWSQWQATFDVESDVLLDILADLDRKAELGTRGNASKVVTASSGDTWESLSMVTTGSPDAVARMRAANGIRYGERPVPGFVYVVP